MCESELEPKYRALTQGRTFLESCLHNNLAEHINSEIGLGTITNVDSAKHWLHSSFLFRRIQKNPRHYAIGKGGNQTWQERIDEMVLESIERLKKNQLVESPDDDHTVLMSTEYGDIMSKVRLVLSLSRIANCTEQYYIRQSTVPKAFFDRAYRSFYITDESYTEAPRESDSPRYGKWSDLGLH